MTDASVWQLDPRSHSARLTQGSFQAVLRVQAPHEGMGQLVLCGRSQPGRILRVVGSSRPTAPGRRLRDAFVRGADLIATYAQTERIPFRLQVYWRAVRPTGSLPALAAVDVIASVESNLMESHPCICITSNLSAEQLCSFDGQRLNPASFATPQSTGSIDPSRPGCLLMRLPGGARSVAVMVHPDDLRDATVVDEGADNVRATHRLFSAPLEKGVILRARVRTVFVPRADDVVVASAWYRALLAEKLPLTA